MYTSTKFVDNRIAQKGQDDFLEAQVGLHYKCGMFPLWLEKDARRLAKMDHMKEAAEHYGPLQALINEYNNPFAWFDHVGLLRLKKREHPKESEQVLIVEPYGIWHDCLVEMMRFASDLNLRIQIEAAGSWYPTHTVRVMFFKKL